MTLLSHDYINNFRNTDKIFDAYHNIVCKDDEDSCTENVVQPGSLSICRNCDVQKSRRTMKEEEVERWPVSRGEVVEEIAKRLRVLVLNNIEKVKIQGINNL